MSVAIIIPARYDSTRFPGKPLAKINGKEMLLHVYEGCKKGFSYDDIYVTTDNDTIGAFCLDHDVKVIITPECPNGMIRVAEAAKQIDAEIIVYVQGDEPLINSEDIKKCIYYKRELPEYVINCFGYAENDIENKNTIKIIENGDSLLYASRSPIPYNSTEYKKQICIYVFYKSQLLRYYTNTKKAFYENLEGIDILRLIEYGQKVKMVPLFNGYQSVDVPEDIKKVENILNSRNNS